MYPAGHPAIEQKLGEIDGAVQQHLQESPTLKLDVIHRTAHLDGVSFRSESETQAHDPRRAHRARNRQHPHRSYGPEAGAPCARREFLWQLRETPSATGAIDVELARRGVRNVSLGRLVPLDTRWHAAMWLGRAGRSDGSDYAESLALAERTFDDVAGGKGTNVVTVRDIVQLLIQKVAGAAPRSDRFCRCATRT